MSKCVKNAAEETKKESLAAFGTGAFAFLNLMSISVILIFFLIGLCIVETATGNDKWDTFMKSILYGVILFVFIVFVFSALLFLGIYKKKPSFVLAYFIFGVILDITLISAGIIYIYDPTSIPVQYLHKFMPPVGINEFKLFIKYIIGINVVYALLLYMICRAWIVMRSRCSEDRQKLINQTTADVYVSEKTGCYSIHL